MPNITDDNLLDQAAISYLYSRNPTNADFSLQASMGSAINTASAAGLFTASFNASGSPQVLRELMIKRLVDMGYGASISGTTITATWANVL